MSEEQFWAIIETKLDWSREGDDEGVIAPAIAVLARMNVEEIEGFASILAEKLYALDTDRHAREIGEFAYDGPDGGFSVDWFLYTRCCALANGRCYYEAVLSDPTKMPKDMEFEALITIAPAAYEQKTGEAFDFDTPLSFETFSNEAGWPEPD
jgi:hypothetical protein